MTGFFTPVMLLVLLGLANLPRVWNMCALPYPKERPVDFSPEAWPTYFAAGAFYHNRGYGLLFIVALLIDSGLRLAGVL